MNASITHLQRSVCIAAARHPHRHGGQQSTRCGCDHQRLARLLGHVLAGGFCGLLHLAACTRAGLGAVVNAAGCQVLGTGGQVESRKGTGLGEDAYDLQLQVGETARRRAGLYSDLIELTVAPI